MHTDGDVFAFNRYMKVKLVHLSWCRLKRFRRPLWIPWINSNRKYERQAVHSKKWRDSKANIQHSTIGLSVLTYGDSEHFHWSAASIIRQAEVNWAASPRRDWESLTDGISTIHACTSIKVWPTTRSITRKDIWCIGRTCSWISPTSESAWFKPTVNNWWCWSITYGHVI